MNICIGEEYAHAKEQVVKYRKDFLKYRSFNRLQFSPTWLIICGSLKILNFTAKSFIQEVEKLIWFKKLWTAVIWSLHKNFQKYQDSYNLWGKINCLTFKASNSGLVKHILPYVYSANESSSHQLQFLVITSNLQNKSFE